MVCVMDWKKIWNKIFLLCKFFLQNTHKRHSRNSQPTDGPSSNARHCLERATMSAGGRALAGNACGNAPRRNCCGVRPC